MIGISISLYDKFDDLAVLVDIIRENWKQNYYISVCSNHPDAPDRMADLDLDIDNFTYGTQINYDPEMVGLREQVNRICRVYDTIRGAAVPAIEADDVSYIMHVHADAWPLSENAVHNLIEEMETQESQVAFKGKGLAHRGHRLVGHMMDQFFVLNADYAAKKEFFEHSPFELLPDRGIHTMMTVLLLGKVGWSNVYFYSDQSEQVFWDDQSATGARPMAFNPNYEFFHLATEDFPEDLGESLQAYYLHERGLTEGEHLSDLIDEHYVPSEQLLKRLETVEQELDSQILFFNTKDLGRNFRLAKDYVEKPATERVLFLVRGGLNRALKKLSDLEPILDKVLNRQIPRVDPVERADDFDRVYAEALRLNDFPAPYNEEMWFLNRDD